MIIEALAICTVLKIGAPVGRSKMMWEPKQITFDTGTNIIMYEITEEERALLERVVMSEAGNQDYEAQEAVATVVLNRVFCPDKFGDNIKDVINAEGQFSTHDNGFPTVSCRLAVHNALQFYGGPCQLIPSQIYYFRSGHYHDFGLDYCRFDDLYFSAPKDACLD